MIKSLEWALTLITVIFIFWLCNWMVCNPKNIEQFDDMYKHSCRFTFTNGSRINLNIEIMSYAQKLATLDPELRVIIGLYVSPVALDEIRVKVHPFCGWIRADDYAPWIKQVYDYSAFKYSWLSRVLDLRPSMKPFYKWSQEQYKILDAQCIREGYKKKGYIF